MPAYVVIGIIVAIGIVVGLGLVAALARSSSVAQAANRQYAALGMSIGMLFGALLGAIVWTSTGDFVFWVIFTGGGLVTGLAIGGSLARSYH
jgi:uncharacterized transporter YbjL